LVFYIIVPLLGIYKAYTSKSVTYMNSRVMKSYIFSYRIPVHASNVNINTGSTISKRTEVHQVNIQHRRPYVL
jgi:hypothetical protein